jgi:PAS domain S-box-containing protein
MPPANGSGSTASELRAPDMRGKAAYALTLCGVAIVYFALAKGGLALASINLNATPIWPPTGFALAAVLLWGYGVWPAVFVAAFLTNLTTAGTLATSLAIAAGNTVECVLAGYMIRRWSDGVRTFDSPIGVVRFAALSLSPAPLISATVGVCALTMAGLAEWSKFGSIWLTWWLGDATGAMVVTPVIVLWATTSIRSLNREQIVESAVVFLATIVVGLIAFSPLIEQSVARAPLSFLAILPLILAALRRGPRDTATVSLLLACFAVWGTAMNSGPFAQTTLNESFLLLLAFVISITIPSLALSSDVAVRRRTEEHLRTAQEELEERVRRRTEHLDQAIAALQEEVNIRRAIETEITEQRVHLLEAQRLANLGSWSWDVAHGKVTWSQQLYKIYGAGPRDFGGTFDDFVARLHPDDRERVKGEIMRAFQSGRPFHLEERIVRPNGEVRQLQSTGEVVVNERGEVVRMLGICLDVTDRKATATALRESEEQYRRLVNSVRDYAICMLDTSGRIVNWNAGAARINRYAAAEILGKHFSQFYTAEDRAADEPARALKVAATDGRYEAEGWRVRKDGSRFWASAIIDPIHNDDGALVGFAKITRDITERRESQIALVEASEKLMQAQKMEALGQLTGGIAHDFNNLLMIVSGHAQILRRGPLEEKQLRAIDAISAAASRGENLTRQLLAFSRRQPLSPVVVDLRARIEAVRQMLGSSLRGDIELQCEMPENLWPTEVDLSELELALVNIAVNARDAMPEGGKIALSASNVTLELGDATDDIEGDFVAITMTDTGTGIPRNVLSKVFEPFFTTKAADKGTGLGLSQVYGFARQSGGGVTIKSQVGEGTSITLYLPRSRRPVAAATPDASEPTPRGHGTILVVEDNPEVANVTSTLLTQLGYQVMQAGGANEALSLLQKTAVDLVFSDIVMPGPMNGLVLAREIKMRYPALPVVLTSGYSDVARGAESEFVILRKPFQVAALERTMREALERGRDAVPTSGERAAGG